MEKVVSPNNYGGGREENYKWRRVEGEKQEQVASSLTRGSFSHTHNTVPQSRDNFSLDATCF